MCYYKLCWKWLPVEFDGSKQSLGKVGQTVNLSREWLRKRESNDFQPDGEAGLKVIVDS
ncbi:hypothetical protein H6F93_33135 [Leptolyngbya sp. FACHB-671]|nr:hypothetical protein [Leptolyngbya sp. FACHB-671]